ALIPWLLGPITSLATIVPLTTLVSVWELGQAGLLLAGGAPPQRNALTPPAIAGRPRWMCACSVVAPSRALRLGVYAVASSLLVAWTRPCRVVDGVGVSW